MAPPPPWNLAIVGTGLVGSKLISQIASLPSWNNQFRVVYIASSRRSLIAPQGIDLSSWKEKLIASTEKPVLAELPRPGIDHGKLVVVDNTSSDDVASLYPHFLSRGFSVVTPNKKAYSSSLELYNQILAASNEGGAKIFYESTVGAGLPIISTLKDLIQTGDKVTRIEGVLSGTLSYLFNEYSPATSTSSPPKSFASVVKIAKEQGYTEPHPADDLSGSDVARKLTILSRLIPELRNALPKGYESVAITSLIPKVLINTVWDMNGDEFVKRLEEFDGEFEVTRTKAAEKGMVLRYVGVIDVKEKIIKAALEPYPVTHPFATSLSGSDNIIAFHTERYGPRPLIVQGAGAGADVTAMGVLGDLFKIQQ